MKHKFLLLNTLHVLNDGYYASLILLLPFLAESIGLNLSEAGVLGSLPGLLAIALAIPAGTMSVRFGAVRVLIFAVFGYSLAYLLLPFSTSFFTVFPIFILAGAAFGVFHPIAFSLVARLVEAKNRGKALGKLTALGDTGKIGVSAGVTFLAAYIGWQHTSSLYGVLALLFFLFFIATHIKNRKTHVKLEKPQHVSYKRILSNKRFLLASLAGMCDYLSSVPLFIFLPFLLLSKGIPASLLGSLVGAYFVGNLLGKATMGRLTDKHGYVKVFVTAELLTGFFILLLTFSSGVIPIIVVSIILGTLTKGTVPVTQTMVTDSVEHHGNFEKPLSLYALFSHVAIVFSTVFLGFISDRFGITTAFVINSLFAFSAVIPAVIFTFVKKQKEL